MSCIVRSRLPTGATGFGAAAVRVARSPLVNDVMKGSAPTIHDLAKKLNLSSTTVWRALNNSPEVSVATRKRIMLAAEKYKYQPSLVAQTLSSGRTQTLGVLVPAISNPVYATLVRAVEQVAFERGYNIILCDSDYQVDRERQYIELLVRRRVEGVVVLPFAVAAQSDYDHLTSLPQRGVSVVAMQQNLSDKHLDRVLPDIRNAARMLTQHLIGLGHRNIGFLHDRNREWNLGLQERLTGYRAALEEAGIGYDEANVLQAGSFESALRDGSSDFAPDRVSDFLSGSQRPTALVATTDRLAIKAMKVIRDVMRLRIPEDVAIVGFDDIPESAYVSPPLTTIRQPTVQIGRRAAELLFDRINAGGRRKASLPTVPVQERIPSELIIRESCGARLAAKGTC
jgi:DNA-binding LacI/PurR family transcriptional regulator